MLNRENADNYEQIRRDLDSFPKLSIQNLLEVRKVYKDIGELKISALKKWESFGRFIDTLIDLDDHKQAERYATDETNSSLN